MPRNRHNRVLAALPEDDRIALQGSLEPVQLALRDILHEIEQPIRHVYFVTSGVVSITRLREMTSTPPELPISQSALVG